MAECRDQGLLLRRIPYGETSLICHLLTANQGRIALMARGARRKNSPFLAALAPIHELHLQWKPGRRGMGTLIECERRASLLPEARFYEGMELCALACDLFREGDPHGYGELRHALLVLAQGGIQQARLAAVWHLLSASGWVGHLASCWMCGRDVNKHETMYWQWGRLICHDCGRGRPVAPIQRRLLALACEQAVEDADVPLDLWKGMIGDILAAHGLRRRASLFGWGTEGS
ncbi:MAG: DNA repair protein RecO [Zetaproteobacteria bacterium]|nr:MAG: DNA repair protein RecO [Zetaproteobacteria bacterium]